MCKTKEYFYFAFTGGLRDGDNEPSCAAAVREPGLREGQAALPVLPQRRRRAQTQTLAQIVNATMTVTGYQLPSHQPDGAFRFAHTVTLFWLGASHLQGGWRHLIDLLGWVNFDFVLHYLRYSAWAFFIWQNWSAGD